MSYDENDAAQDAFYEQLGLEAIDEFTADRLKSYYDDHEAVMQPALQALHEAEALLDVNHHSAAIVFSASAIELFLKTTILQPLVYGMVHNNKMASIIVDYALGQTGFGRYKTLLANLFQEIADLDLKTIRRKGSSKPLIEECTKLSAQRNDILHRGVGFAAEDALIAYKVSSAAYELLVRPMLAALGLYILREGIISTSRYRTVKRADGVRVTAEDIPIEKPTHLQRNAKEAPP